MYSLPFLDSSALTWVIGLFLGAFLVYYYTTKTDIPKIKGIPEIPGALPMYLFPTSKLMTVLDIYSNLEMYHGL
jgi:hypothetical protein